MKLYISETTGDEIAMNPNGGCPSQPYGDDRLQETILSLSQRPRKKREREKKYEVVYFRNHWRRRRRNCDEPERRIPVTAVWGRPTSGNDSLSAPDGPADSNEDVQQDERQSSTADSFEATPQSAAAHSSDRSIQYGGAVQYDDSNLRRVVIII